jgi:hypothetical protein
LQNREPPAFQEYASAIMSKIEYRAMTLAERGLLYTLRLELWVNGKLPSDPTRLAKVLGFADEEVRQALPAVMPFLTEFDGFVICPELESYRIHLENARKRMSAGGRRSAEKRASKSA